MKRLTMLLIIIFQTNLFADSSMVIKTAEHYYKNGEYYNAITESMRYQHLFRQGSIIRPA